MGIRVGTGTEHSTRKQLWYASEIRHILSLREGILFTTQRMGLLLAVASVTLNLIWVAAVKPLQAPDEPAHLQAVMEVRNKLIIPEVHYDLSYPEGRVIGNPGDKSARDYAERLGFTDPFFLIPYESMQPPLYYLIAGILALIVPPDPQIVLYLSRCIAALFGAAAVYFIWAATRQLAPRAPGWATMAAAAVALLPQFCFNSATAANDSAINFCGALMFYVLFRGLRQPSYDPFLLKAGGVFGLAVLAKLTAIAFLPGL